MFEPEIFDFFSEPPASQEEFVQLKKMADHENSADALFTIASCFEQGIWVSKSLKKAIKYYKKAADQGHIQGQIWLSHLFESGTGVKQDYSQAIYYCQLAANQESSTAFVLLGTFYAEGKGVEKSPETAFKYYQRAAAEENIVAWSYLAEAYENGIGVQKSEEIAKFWRKKIFDYFKEIADDGDPISQISIGNFFENGSGVEKSLEMAFKYYQLAAKQNYSKGLLFLAECYAEGKGIEKSLTDAIKNYKLAADQGDVFGQYFFAKFILQNKINEYEQDQAIYYLKSAIKNNPPKNLLALCENDLAECFENGIGVTKSLKSALRYYELAASHGLNSAKNKLIALKKYKKTGKSENHSKNLQSAQKVQTISKTQTSFQPSFWYPTESNAKLFCIEPIKQKADTGDPESQYEYGIFCLDHESQESQEEGINYLNMAANQKHVLSILVLGHHYYDKFFILPYVEESLLDQAMGYFEKVKNSFSLKESSEKNPWEIVTWNYYTECEEMLSKLKKTKEKGKYRLNAEKIHNLSDSEFFYPNSKKINLEEIVNSLNNNSYNYQLLKDTLDKYKDIACYLINFWDLDNEEINIIRDAMLENPRLTFVGIKSDFYALWLAFNRAGYGDHCLKRTDYRTRYKMWDGQKAYALLFVG